MAKEQVSTNTAEGKGKLEVSERAQEESRRLDTVVDRLIFLRETFMALGDGGEDYTFSPFAFTGLSLIVTSIKVDAGDSLEFVQMIARELEASHE